jgi:peptidoglycan-N-acetylglucosamine deacetylase
MNVETDRVAAVNVDIDSLYLYYRLHGLDEDSATNVIWEKGVPRFMELFAAHGIRATFFVVGADLERWPSAMEGAKKLVKAGHELGNHSYSHPYDFSLGDHASIFREIDRAHTLISEAAGREICGFRAPGYNMSENAYRALAQRGYLYSSSIFPSPPYMLAKWGVMATMLLRGKRSDAIWGNPSMMFASRAPHHRRAVLEMPITVLPGIRFPFIGTTLAMMGTRGYKITKPFLSRASFLNLEFHGIDLMDLDADGIDPTLRAQRDLRIGLDEKLDVFSAVLSDAAKGWEVQTLEELAPRFKGPKAK